MPKVTYRFVDGSSKTLEAAAGVSVMHVATHNDLPGILGRCGGFCNCGTCHVYVDDAWAGLVGEPSIDEDAMLDDCAAERKSGSRLSCQIVLTDALDGLVVDVPYRQEFD